VRRETHLLQHRLPPQHVGAVAAGSRARVRLIQNLGRELLAVLPLG
jgi:hypothetical protein